MMKLKTNKTLKKQLGTNIKNKRIRIIFKILTTKIINQPVRG